MNKQFDNLIKVIISVVAVVALKPRLEVAVRAACPVLDCFGGRAVAPFRFCVCVCFFLRGREVLNKIRGHLVTTTAQSVLPKTFTIHPKTNA